jgi:hypothetical protein
LLNTSLHWGLVSLGLLLAAGLFHLLAQAILFVGFEGDPDR